MRWHRRLQTIRVLADAGIPVSVLVAPVIPVLTDPELDSILAAAREAGVQSAAYIMLRLPLEVSELFQQWLHAVGPFFTRARMAHLFRVVTIEDMWGVRVLMVIAIALGVALVGESVAGGPLVPTSIAPALPGTSDGKPGPGMFLVARRALDDSHFGQSVIYLVEHDEEGTLGLIVNRASAISLSEAIPDIEDKRAAAHALYYGGPVGLPMILMLVRSELATEGMAHVADDVYISSDRGVLEEVLAAKKPASELRFYIGYSGWAGGQLDFELERGSWHVVAADPDAVFSGDTDSLWDRLIEQLEPTGIHVDIRPFLSAMAF